MNPTIIKRNRVCLDAPAPATPRSASGVHPAGGGKRVRLLEQGGRVHAIELTCSCGEISVIELDYPDSPRP